MPTELQLNLTREQLARFLPNHEAIKAFENLILLVSENLPVMEGELAEIVTGIPRVNVDAIRRVVEGLEAMQLQRPNLDPLVKRLETLERQPNQKANLSGIAARLAAIEAYLGI